MKKLVLIIMSLFLILLVGCYKTGQAGLVPGRDICTSNRDCESGRICVNYSCVPRPCMKDRDCGSGMKCVSGKCVTWTCETNADCKRGIICLLTGRCNMICENGRCVEFPRELPNPPRIIPPPRNAPPSVCVLDMVLCADRRTYVARCPPDCRPCPCPGTDIPKPPGPRWISQNTAVVQYWDGTRFVEIPVIPDRKGQLTQPEDSYLVRSTKTVGPSPGPTEGTPPTTKTVGPSTGTAPTETESPSSSP